MTEQTTHEPYDFIAAASIPTNEQRMVAALEQIVVLLTPAVVSATELKPNRADQIAQLAAKTMGTGGKRK